MQNNKHDGWACEASNTINTDSRPGRTVVDDQSNRVGRDEHKDWPVANGKHVGVVVAARFVILVMACRRPHQIFVIHPGATAAAAAAAAAAAVGAKHPEGGEHPWVLRHALDVNEAKATLADAQVGARDVVVRVLDLPVDRRVGDVV